LTSAGLRGKVVLVNFWTYTCINWLRQLPYLRAWAKKYSSQGLVLVGVHTPEFGFEGNPDNVARAVRELAIDYPVALDDKYEVWNDFGNMYWPALYFADADGVLQERHFGEGKYELSERVIQKLLGEAGTDLVAVQGVGAESPADWANLRSPETYLGYARTTGFAASGGAVPDKPHTYQAAAELRLNHWALDGDWTVTDQASTSNAADGRFVYRFHSRDLHLVMGPADPTTTVRFRVLLDGVPAATGVDADDQGNGVVTGQRLYQLVHQPGPIVDRTFEITFLDAGVEIYATTFG
jgi:thiol-disulfide isomerase/thioredoxin